MDLASPAILLFFHWYRTIPIFPNLPPPVTPLSLHPVSSFFISFPNLDTHPALSLLIPPSLFSSLPSQPDPSFQANPTTPKCLLEHHLMMLIIGKRDWSIGFRGQSSKQRDC
ncbi:hypothetical protein L1887_05027 [Cichorium endivia]|nr:hypothetical protein L1887_05027 [Cichorium endivia]